MANIEMMKAQIQELNEKLKNKYEVFFDMDNDTFRKEVLKDIGNITTLSKLSMEELSQIGLLVGVDGSVAKVGGADPHYVEIYQALAKPSKGENIFESSVFSPMVQNDSDTGNRDVMLARIEMKAAIKAIDTINPKIIMMDGGLIRYKINDNELFDILVEKCRNNNILLMGVIKDIKTEIIARSLEKPSYFDRELLYGRLYKGEMLVINDECNNKFGDAGLVSAFIRGSIDSMIIGIDVLKEYREQVLKMGELVYSLIPEHSRGVPYWLDIVDAEVKISEKTVKSILEEYLDRDIYRRFFVSEREGRTL